MAADFIPHQQDAPAGVASGGMLPGNPTGSRQTAHGTATVKQIGAGTVTTHRMK